MNRFIYDSLATRVIFGVGSLDSLPEEVSRLGSKALVLCTPYQRDQVEEVAKTLGTLAVGFYDKAAMHVPIETAQDARKEADRVGADVYVTVGGGSTTGLGKAIALQFGCPIVSVPTTYAGSEMTPIWGLTESGIKKTGRDKKVLPRTVIYDPTLTTSLPAMLSATSGMNAIAHAVEALYAQDRNPIINIIAGESIRALAQSLPEIMKDPKDLEARAKALYGAWLAGMSLGSVGMALHHKLCHTLGGSFNLPHAEVHTIVLPHAAAYNAAAAPDAMVRVAQALGAGDAAGGLYDLAVSLGARIALREIGMREDDLEK